jgi:hypothetical protein
MGLSVSDARLTPEVAGETVSVAVLMTPNEAEMVAEVEAATETVVTVNVALAAPVATVTLAGTPATPVLLLESVTTAPPDGAAAVSVTVPCEALPPVTVAGLSERVESVTGDGSWAGPELTLNLLVEDQAPAVPAELCARTRHQTVVTGRLLLVNSDAVTV